MLLDFDALTVAWCFGGLVTTDRLRVPTIIGTVAGIAAALLLALTFPAVEGLGSKVRLPVFHGALTWVNLGAFALLAIAAIVSLVWERESAYRWEAALRWISISMWILGSALGLLAALNTWDFSGAKSSRMSFIIHDERLKAQFLIMIVGLVVMALMLVFRDRFWRSVFDIAFVAFALGMILLALRTGGGDLHPDSPVLNSEEIGIKLRFFGMAFSLAVALICGARLLATAPVPSDDEE